MEIVLINIESENIDLQKTICTFKIVFLNRWTLCLSHCFVISNMSVFELKIISCFACSECLFPKNQDRFQLKRVIKYIKLSFEKNFVYFINKKKF